MKAPFIIALTLMPVAAYAGYVQGYTRKDGKQVAPYYRSDADGTKSNNRACTDNVDVNKAIPTPQIKPKVEAISM